MLPWIGREKGGLPEWDVDVFWWQTNWLLTNVKRDAPYDGVGTELFQ